MSQQYQTSTRGKGAFWAVAIVIFAVVAIACMYFFWSSGTENTNAGGNAKSVANVTATADTAQQATNPGNNLAVQTGETVGTFDPNNPPPAVVPSFLPSTARLINEKPVQVFPDSWKYSRYYAGNDNTSSGFTQEVYNYFLANLDDFDDGFVVFKAPSPATGYKYEMRCVDQGTHVTCTGGYNAVVYIV